MKVTYTSPNRSHHYRFAAALARADCLRCFVSGFSRFGPGADVPELRGLLRRADHLQNIYLASLRLRFPPAASEELAHLSKLWLDRLSEKPARESDVFFFYNGAGLRTARRLEATGVVRVVEAVTSHVRVQEEIMREEHRRLGLPPPYFHPRDTARRVEEYAVADAVVCASGFARRSFLDQGMPAERIHVVPYGLTPPALAETPSSVPARDETFRVLYVGQITPRKGLCYLFEAFAGLRHPRKELVIVGAAGQPTGLEKISPPTGTIFRGVLRGEALARAYRAADVFVLPSVEDGFGLVLGEALGFGVPVIATANTGAADLFEPGREGFIVPIRDPAAIRERLQHLADDPALREQMSRAARERAGELQGWDACGRRLVETLAGIARRARG